MSKTNSQVRVGVAVFVWKDNKFLMGKRIGAHGENTWSLPGGHIEVGETPVQAAQRETLEEAGLGIKNIKFLTYTNDLFTENKHYITLWFEADWASGRPTINEPDKWIEQTWVNKNDLPSPLFEPCFTNFNRALPTYLID